MGGCTNSDTERLRQSRGGMNRKAHFFKIKKLNTNKKVCANWKGFIAELFFLEGLPEHSKYLHSLDMWKTLNKKVAPAERVVAKAGRHREGAQ